MRHGLRRLSCIFALAAGAAWTASAGEKSSASGSGVVSITKEDYAGWPNTYRLDNGVIEARVVTDVGPRIIDLRLKGGENLLHVRPAEAGKNGESEWMFRGGWRLWIAPERRETTYELDNVRCAAEVRDGHTLVVTGPAQATAGIRKRIEVSLAPDAPWLRLVSRIRNISDRTLTYAAWSLSVMRPGGRAFVPLDVGPLDAFDATRKLILWSYAEFSDPRYAFGDRLVQIDQRRVQPPAPGQGRRRDDESKIGVDSAQGWAAYLLDGMLYLKRFPHDDSGTYPDGGAKIQIYSSHEFLEVENLGPLATISPGQEIVLPEAWWLFADVTVPQAEDAALQALSRYVSRTAETR